MGVITGELLVSALGLAMVAELCPRNRSGFVMGIWFLTMMLAGPIAAWVGGLTAPAKGVTFSAAHRWNRKVKQVIIHVM